MMFLKIKVEPKNYHADIFFMRTALDNGLEVEGTLVHIAEESSTKGH